MNYKYLRQSLIFGLGLMMLSLSGCAKQPVETDLTKMNEATETKIEGVNNKLSEIKVIDETVAPVEEKVAIEDNTIVETKNVESLYFAYDVFTLDDAMQTKALENYNILKEQKTDALVVEGNCDEWGSDEYNYALGLKRAKTVKDAMVSFGFNESNINLVSMGESNPSCTDHNEECWSKNRRVDFKVIQ